jgi:hypothetical protein
MMSFPLHSSPARCLSAAVRSTVALVRLLSQSLKKEIAFFYDFFLVSKN